jgi:hypothetical protein
VRENITTGEGWARIGFFIPIIISLYLGYSLLLALLSETTPSENSPNTQSVGTLMLLGSCFAPLTIIAGAFRAMEAPTDRNHLAKTGFKTTTQLIFVFSSIFAAMSIGGVIMLCVTKPTAYIGLLYVLVGFVVSCVYYVIGLTAEQDAKSMRNVGWQGFVVIAVLLVVLALVSTQMALAFLPITIMFGFLQLSLFAAGGLFMWMQREGESGIS